jgi:hypothetical protein
MPNPLETLQIWLEKPPPIPNVYPTVAVTLFTWSQYDPPPGPPDYTYNGWAQNVGVGAGPGVLGVPGLKVSAAALTVGSEQYLFFTEMAGNAAGQVLFEGLTIQSPDSPTAGTVDSGPAVISSDGGEFVELDFQVIFQQAGILGGTLKECHLYMQQSGRYIVPPKKVIPIKDPIVQPPHTL